MMPTKLYDLSHPMYHNCPGWPDYAPNVINHDYRAAVHGFNAETLTFNTHTATHIDVPYHFFDDGDTIDKLPLDRFAGPGVFIDLRPMELDSVISAEKLKPFINRVEPGDIVLINTGWAARRDFTDEYLHRWPYLDESGAVLLSEAGVKAVGVDGLSMGGWGAEKARPCHLHLLSRGIILIEEVLFPEAVMDGKKRFVSAFPLHLAGCGGSPVRLVAYEFD